MKRFVFVHLLFLALLAGSCNKKTSETKETSPLEVLKNPEAPAPQASVIARPATKSIETNKKEVSEKKAAKIQQKAQAAEKRRINRLIAADHKKRMQAKAAENANITTENNTSGLKKSKIAYKHSGKGNKQNKLTWKGKKGNQTSRNWLPLKSSGSNGLEEDLNENLNLTDLYKILEKKAEVFTINHDRDTILICKEGTRIRIPANSLESEKTGKSINGKVQILIKEYYRMSDMVLANLTTRSDEAILETGGMVHISAIADNEPCKLKNNRLVEIGFPYQSHKNNMQLFNGDLEGTTINWKPAKAGNSDSRNFRNNSSNNFTRDSTKLKHAYFRGGEKGIRSMLAKRLVYPYSAIMENIEGTVLVSFVIDDEGGIRNGTVIESSNPVLNLAAIHAVHQMSGWKPARYEKQTFSDFDTVAVNFSLAGKKFNKRKLRTLKKFENKNLKYIRKEKYYQYPRESYYTVLDEIRYPKGYNRISTGDTINKIGNYAFSSSGLGWINCDRFNYSISPRIEYKVKEKGNINTDVKIVFNSIKSILAGSGYSSYYSFFNVPEDEGIIIIAFKTQGDKIFLALKESITSRFPENELYYEQVTLEELKQKIENLNRFP